MIPCVLNEWDTLDAVIRDRRSLARLGDGECKIASGRDCKTQVGSPDIAKRMRRVLLSDDRRVLVAIPRIFDREPPLAQPGFWPQHAQAFHRMCRPGATYGSSFVSRRDAWPIENEKLFWQWWQRIWNRRPVLLVTGSNKGRRAEGKLLGNAASVDRLDCPKQDAWAVQEALLADCMAWAAAKADPVVTLACGPTATILAHALGVRGVQAIDIGHAPQAYARLAPSEDGDEP